MIRSCCVTSAALGLSMAAALLVSTGSVRAAESGAARLVVAAAESTDRPAAKADRTPAGRHGNADKQAKAEKPSKAEPKPAANQKLGKPVQLATFGDWGAFLAQGGKEKTCYALAMPKERLPSTLKRDQAFVFISSRPAENVRNEVSVIMGFPMKDGGEAKAEIAGTNFDLIAKGSNAWVKNPAQEPQFIDAMKHGSKLVVKAPSVKGKVTTDSYSLAGLSQALERVQKECP